MGLRATWTDSRHHYFLSQNQLEKIGIGISDCNLCKQIHILAKLERENSGKWVIETRDDALADHIKAIAIDGACPNTDSSNRGSLFDELS